MQSVLEDVDLADHWGSGKNIDGTQETDHEIGTNGEEAHSGGDAKLAADVMGFWGEDGNDQQALPTIGKLSGLKAGAKADANKVAGGNKFRQNASSLNKLFTNVDKYRKNPTPKSLAGIEKEMMLLPADKKKKYAGVLGDIRGSIDGGQAQDGDGGPDLDGQLDAMAIDGPRMVTNRDAKAAELARWMGDSMDVVSSKKKNRLPNEVTRKEMKQTYGLLRDVYTGEGNRNLRLTPPQNEGEYYHHVADAKKTGRGMPKELGDIEGQIDDIKPSKKDQRGMEKDLAGLADDRAALQKMKGRTQEQEEELKQLNKQIPALRNKIHPDVSTEAGEYDAKLGNIVQREAMKDVVRIAQTGVGRNLLTELSTDQSGHPVDIRAQGRVIPADAGRTPGANGADYANYTPQAFKERDPRYWEDKGTFEAAKHNKWQINNRSDITLFHELTHALHYQRGDLDPNDAKTANEMVDDDTAVKAVDKPYKNGFGEEAGVRKEEYRTVGLGAHRNDAITENRYRLQRRKMGENVPRRTAYVHKGADGQKLTANTLDGDDARQPDHSGESSENDNQQIEVSGT